MKRQTRKLLVNMTAGLVVATAGVVVLLPSAQAYPGTITSNVNVRQGPGTNFPVLDSVARGTPVDVQQCDGPYCFVVKPGPDGWVSSQYIDSGDGPATQPGAGFGITISPNGGISIGGGSNTVPRPPRPPVYEPPIDEVSEVCFYDRTRFRGQSQCLESGDTVRDLGGFAERISSVDNPDGLEVQICGERNFRDCRTLNGSASSLGDFDDYIVSVRVR